MRLIDADDIVYESIDSSDTSRYEYYYGTGIMAVRKEDIDAMPTIEERKTGRWIDAVLPNDDGGLPVQVCDQCNTFFPLAYTGGGHNFCPNCGADMRGEQDG